LGTGFGGQFERNYTLLSFTGGESVEPGIVHNQFLTFWLKMGFIGLAAYIWVFISFFRFARRVIPVIPRSWGEAVSLGLYAALWGDLFMELWGPSWVGNTKFPIVVFSSLAFAVCLNRSGPPFAVAKGAIHDEKGQP
jgi:O-antigen ligase